MFLISEKIIDALIEGASTIPTKKLKLIIGDFNTDCGNDEGDLFLLGVELGKLFVFEESTRTYGGNMLAEINTTILNVAAKLNEK